MAVFESGWRANLSEEEGKKLVRDAIAAGIFNDLGSGSNVDLCVIRNTGPAQYLRTYEEANIKVTFTKDFSGFGHIGMAWRYVIATSVQFCKK